MTAKQRSPITTPPFVEKTRDGLSGERFTITGPPDDQTGSKRVPIEYTLEEVFRVMEDLGLRDMETIEMIKAARMTFWRAGRGIP